MQSSIQIVTTNKPTPSFLQAGSRSCRPNNSVKALKENAAVINHCCFWFVFSGHFSRLSWMPQKPSEKQPLELLVREF